MRREPIDAIVGNAGKRPEKPEHDRGDREPAPQAHARHAESGGGDDGEIEVERPIVGPVGPDDQRCDIGADKAEPGERRPVQQGGCERRQRDQAEQHEGDGRSDESVESVGGVDVGIGDGGTGGSKDARNMCARQAGQSAELLAAARPFAGDDEREREQRAEDDAHAGAEPSLLDRIAHQEEAAEHERDAADPDDPLSAEALFQADRWLGFGSRNGRRWRDRGCGSDRRLE